MKKLLATLLSALLLASCATYTVQDGRNAISVSDEKDRAETRFHVIKERKDREHQAYLDKIRAEEEKKELELKREREEEERLRAEEELRLQAEREEEERLRAEEELRLQAEREAEEERRKAAFVNEYPEDASAISYPHIYAPKKSRILKEDSGIVRERLLFIPLGISQLTDENISSVISGIEDLDAEIIALTGSIENQIAFAESYGYDAATLKGGTVIFRAPLIEASKDSAVLQVTETKTLDIAVMDFSGSFPWKAEDVKDWLAERKESEQSDLTEALDILSGQSGSRRLLFVSAGYPSTEDWSSITGYAYRSNERFALSDAMEDMRWQDVYRTSNFNAEIDPGITRRSYEVFERLDFIYSYALMPVSAVTVPLSGLTETAGILALLAEVVIPD